MFKVATGFFRGQQSGGERNPYIRARASVFYGSRAASVEWVELSHNTFIAIHRPSAFCTTRQMLSNRLMRKAIYLAALRTDNHENLFEGQMRIRFSHRLSCKKDKTRLIPSRFPQYVAVIAG